MSWRRIVEVPGPERQIIRMRPSPAAAQTHRREDAHCARSSGYGNWGVEVKLRWRAFSEGKRGWGDWIRVVGCRFGTDMGNGTEARVGKCGLSAQPGARFLLWGEPGGEMVFGGAFWGGFSGLWGRPSRHLEGLAGPLGFAPLRVGHNTVLGRTWAMVLKPGSESVDCRLSQEHASCCGVNLAGKWFLGGPFGAALVAYGVALRGISKARLDLWGLPRCGSVTIPFWDGNGHRY